MCRKFECCRLYIIRPQPGPVVKNATPRPSDWESNPRPLDYQTSALPLSYRKCCRQLGREFSIYINEMVMPVKYKGILIIINVVCCVGRVEIQIEIQKGRTTKGQCLKRQTTLSVLAVHRPFCISIYINNNTWHLHSLSIHENLLYIGSYNILVYLHDTQNSYT